LKLSIRDFAIKGIPAITGDFTITDFSLLTKIFLKKRTLINENYHEKTSLVKEEQGFPTI